MNRRLSGFMTTEAAVMFPFLIFVSTIMIYLLIYIYDCILVKQDLNSLVASLKCSEGDFYYAYREIKEEHVYISVEGPDICLTKNGNNYKIDISCNWIFPFDSSKNRMINASSEVKVINPFEIMLYTEDISSIITGEKDDSDENNK